MEKKYKLAVIGYGGTRYEGPEDGSLSSLETYERQVDTSRLAEGAYVVNYLTVTNQDKLISWVVNGPMVNPNIEAVDRFEVDPTLDFMAKELEENFRIPLTDKDYRGLDEWPLKKWIEAVKWVLPNVSVARWENGAMVWEKKPVIFHQLPLFEVEDKPAGQYKVALIATDDSVFYYLPVDEEAYSSSVENRFDPLKVVDGGLVVHLMESWDFINDRGVTLRPPSLGKDLPMWFEELRSTFPNLKVGTVLYRKLWWLDELKKGG